MKLLVFVVFFACLLQAGLSKKKKDPRDYTDADIYALDEQWMDDDEVEEEDLPEHKRKQKPIDIENIDMKSPEAMLKATKKGKTLMMFATISGDPTQEETEKISGLWQSQLANAHIQTERYVISANRVLIKINDGAYAVQIKDFLVDQERCEVVTIDGNDYPGKGSPKKKSKKKKKKTKKTKAKKQKTEL